MINWNPLYIIGLGFVLVMTGFVLPLLMVMRILESTYFLNFLAYGASFSGVMLGVIGATLFTIKRRRK